MRVLKVILNILLLKRPMPV